MRLVILSPIKPSPTSKEAAGSRTAIIQRMLVRTMLIRRQTCKQKGMGRQSPRRTRIPVRMNDSPRRELIKVGSRRPGIPVGADVIYPQPIQNDQDNVGKLSSLSLREFSNLSVLPSWPHPRIKAKEQRVPAKKTGLTRSLNWACIGPVYHPTENRKSSGLRRNPVKVTRAHLPPSSSGDHKCDWLGRLVTARIHQWIRNR